MRHGVRSGGTLALLAVALLGATGCTARRTSCASPDLMRPSGLVPVAPTADDHPILDTTLVNSLAERLRVANASPLLPTCKRTVLALSGGGMYGAYSAGVLSGWTASGTRPEFDVVTGVSTGALLGTYAFLGPAYDRRMAENFLALTDRDIYRRRVPGAALWSDSLASSAPLRRLIETEVDAETLAAVAQAHARGRRFYVGTTNLNTKRLVVWDMGAIASSGRPDALELYRKVLLASASVPGFLPPVEFDITINGERFTELHADGGATTGVFLRASMIDVDPEALKAGQTPLAGSNVYVIVAGKLYSDAGCTERRTMKIGESSLEALLYSQTRSELFRIYTLSILSGMNFHLASIPDDLKLAASSMSFKGEEMRKLYAVGYAAGSAGAAWRRTPPGAEPHEQTRPRSGNDFYAPGAVALPPER